MNDSFEFEKRKMPEVEAILKRHAMFIVKFEIADSEQDTQQATDLVIRISGGAVGVRVRRFESTTTRYRDLTIRSRSRYGQRTEIDKLRDGWGDFYFYGWDNKQGRIEEYMLLDMARFRDSGMLHNPPEKEVFNKDGTAFFPFPATKLHECGCLIVHTIDSVPNKHKAVTRTGIHHSLTSIRSDLANLIAELGIN